jgi:hypothetical protein
MRNRNEVRFEPDGLIAELNGLGMDVEYFEPDFSEKNCEYARIKLTTTRIVADGLFGNVFVGKKDLTGRNIGEINRTLCEPFDTYGCFLRRVDYSELEDNLVSYVVEIVPFKNVKGREDGVDRRVIATRKFLDGLVGAVKNFKMKNRGR